MNSQIFELFFTFFDFFTSHVFDSKSRYIRRFIFFEESDLISLEENDLIFFSEIRLTFQCFREWRNEICVQLNQIMNETTSLTKTQQLHDEIVVFEIFISHDYFEVLKKYSHMNVSFIRQEIRKTLNKYLTTFLNAEVEEFESCRSSSFLSNDLVFAWESFSLKKMKIESKFERLVLIVKKFQNEISSVKAVVTKYDVCRNIILIKVETSVLWLNTSWTVNCSLHMKKKSYLHWWIVSLNWVFSFDFSCWKKRSNWYCENESKTWIWIVTEWNDFWSDILNIERNFLDILIKNVISIRIETFSKDDSNYLTKCVSNIKSSIRTYTTWMRKTIWWEWETRWNKFLRLMLIVMLLYWWVKMIDCLLTDLSTAGELEVYIAIRITQCPLAIEMRAIPIYLYCMWNALLIWSIRWFRRRPFRKQSRTMTNKCLSESEDDHYQLIRKQKVTNLQISLKKIHRSAIASLWDDFSQFYQFIQSYFEWENIRIDCESSNMSR
jgi:hypothetical protein